MEQEEFSIGENYKLKINMIITSGQREYLNIFIKDTSTNEEYNSNFDFDFLKSKAFFQCLNLQIVISIIKEQLKNSKVNINKNSKKNEMKLNITLNKNDEELQLIIPKYDKNEQIDKEEILKLKTLCSNLLFKINEGFTTDEGFDDNKGFTNKIIKNDDEMNLILNAIHKKPNLKIKVKLLYTPTLEENSWRDFHNYCDNKGPTIVLCESTTGKRFGGYTSVSWDLKNAGYHDINAFLFSLDNKKIYDKGNNKQIYCGNNHGVHFWENTLGLIWNEDGKFIGENQSSHYTKGHECFNVPMNALSGADKFYMKEMEVYQVIFE